jgi:phosphoribosylanthranilate isomerase
MNPRGAEVRVKICGVTCREDAEMAVAFGADALGFNTWPGSRRHIDLAGNAEWLRELPAFVARVAVMVNPTRAEAEQVAALPFIDALQFHGEETPEFCAHFAARGIPFVKAIALRDEGMAAGLGRFHTRDVLVDSFTPGAFGGTGRLIDAGLARLGAERNPGVRIILSGGLTAETVGEAVATVRPFAVDVASGVEEPGNPRRKSAERVAAFIRAVRNAVL